MFYYRIGEQLACSLAEDLPYEKAGQPEEVCPLVWLFDREAGSCRASFKVNSPDLCSRTMRMCRG